MGYIISLLFGIIFSTQVVTTTPKQQQTMDSASDNYEMQATTNDEGEDDWAESGE